MTRVDGRRRRPSGAQRTPAAHDRSRWDAVYRRGVTERRSARAGEARRTLARRRSAAREWCDGRNTSRRDLTAASTRISNRVTSAPATSARRWQHRRLEEAQLRRPGRVVDLAPRAPPCSSFTGWTCAATASPTASCHRPNTPPSARDAAADRGRAAQRPDHAGQAVAERDRIAVALTPSRSPGATRRRATVPASMRTIASGWAASGSARGGGEDHLAGGQVVQQRRGAPWVELAEHVVEHEHGCAAGPVGHQAVRGQAQRQRQRALLALRRMGARRACR